MIFNKKSYVSHNYNIKHFITLDKLQNSTFQSVLTNTIGSETSCGQHSDGQ